MEWPVNFQIYCLMASKNVKKILEPLIDIDVQFVYLK